MNLTPFYDVKLIENGKSHFYQIGQDETWYPGVTTILGAVIAKPQLISWAANQACLNIKEYLLTNAIKKPLTKEEIEKVCKEGGDIYKKKSQEALDIGSLVHKTIDGIIKGESVAKMPAVIEPAIRVFLDWKDSHSLRIELGDTKLGSKLFGYGGSMDFLAFDGNDPILFDLKTTKKRKDRDHGVYDEFGFQLSAYSKAFEETYGLKPKACYVFWVNKERPEFKVVKLANIEKSFEGFLAALKLYNLRKFEMFEARHYYD